MIAKIILSEWVLLVLLLLACGNFLAAAGSDNIIQPFGTLGLIFAICCIGWCVGKALVAWRRRSSQAPR